MLVKQNGQGVMRHAFFEGVCFEEIEEMRIAAPWRPEIRHPSDTSHFEKFPETMDVTEQLRDDWQKFFVDF